MTAAGVCYRSRVVHFSLGLLPLLLVFVGCGGGTPVAQPEAQKHIQQISGLYLYYASKHNDVGPGTLEELKAWGKALSASEKQNFGDIDSLCTSPRDNQPYKIVPKIALKAQQMGGSGVTGRGAPAGRGSGGPSGGGSQQRPGATAPKMIVYESTSVDGKRWVGLSLARASKLVTEEEFNQLLGK